LHLPPASAAPARPLDNLNEISVAAGRGSLHDIVRIFMDINKANPFCAAPHGTVFTKDGETLGVFDRETTEHLVLRDHAGNEIMRCGGWIEFIAAAINLEVAK
jgi:hypothetical protein